MPADNTKNFWRVQVLGTAPSTQDIVRGLAETGEAEGLAVQALQQTKGRGRHGNAWTSPMGNLYLSVLLRPSCKADKAGQMAFVVALALSDAMDAVMEDGHAKTLKWPNDILIDGKKVSGILLESAVDKHGRVDYLIIGTGVNIFAAPEGAIGLDSLKKDRIAINTFRDLYLEKLRARSISWQDEGFGQIRAEWLKQAHGIGQEMTIRLPEITYRGVFEGIDAEIHRR
jgi:BirA family transcriptional regulator, biotin operon repressor / biotin---[acetyl-CoA-carboxylase] ligase